METIMAVIALLGVGFGLFKGFQSKRLARKVVEERNRASEEAVSKASNNVAERELKYERILNKARNYLSSSDDS